MTFMKPIRFVLGKIILGLDSVFVPKGVVRDPQLQAKVDADAKNLLMYELIECPFCVKVRRGMKRLNVQIERKNVSADPQAQAELMAGGKLDQVPCLKISDTEWLYESDEILTYLDRRFGSGLM
jgi:glutaredoxin